MADPAALAALVAGLSAATVVGAGRCGTPDEAFALALLAAAVSVIQIGAAG